MSPVRVPRCRHCNEKETKLDGYGYCLDFDACVERKPLTGKYTYEMYLADREYRERQAWKGDR